MSRRKRNDEDIRKTLKVRIGNSVLPKKNWPIACVEISGRAICQVHSLRCWEKEENERLGQTLGSLADWSCYDGTRTAPEFFHEIQDRTGHWRGFWSEGDLVQDLKLRKESAILG